MRKLIYFIIGLVLFVILLIAGCMMFLLSDKGQKWAMDQCLTSLRAELGTKLEIGDFSLNPFIGQFAIHNLQMYDRDSVCMLRVDTAEVGIAVMQLVNKEIVFDHLKLAGASAELYKNRRDTVANYQFLVDALGKNKKPKNKEKKKAKKKSPVKVFLDLDDAIISRTDFKWDIKSEPHKGGDTLDVNHIDVHDFHLAVTGKIKDERIYNFKVTDLGVMEKKTGITLSMDKIHAKIIKDRSGNLILEGLKGKYRDKEVALGSIHIEQKNGKLGSNAPIDISIKKLHYKCNNGKPRKNTGKPNRGWFDPGHLNTELNAELVVSDVRTDTIRIYLDHLDSYDEDSGLDIKNFTSHIDVTKKDIFLTNASIALAKTRIKMRQVHLEYETGKKKGAAEQNTEGVKGADGKPKSTFKMKIHDFPFTAKVYLQDIAKPFAPPLSHFTTPLNLDLVVGGDLDRILFKDILITSFDKRLRLTAQGDLCDVTKKRALCLHFTNIHLDARSGIKDVIINHFSKKVRMKMTQQMRLIGDISFNGTLGVFFKRQEVGGRLFTKFGEIDFGFTINGWTKFLKGWMKAPGELRLGDVMNAPGFSIFNAQARYNVNISKKSRVSLISRARGGRLPVGDLQATIDKAKYKTMPINGISANLVSDGVKAVGDVSFGLKVMDIEAELEYMQTDKVQKYHIKPHIKKHKTFTPLFDKFKAMKKAKEQGKSDNQKDSKDKSKAKDEKSKSKSKDDSKNKESSEDKPKKKNFFKSLFKSK